MTYAYRCPVCEKMFNAKREDARYCSDACRQRTARFRKRLSIERELRKIGDINRAAQRELQAILEKHGPPAARAACRVFWLAVNTPQAPPLAAAPVTPARVTDATRSAVIDPADVPLTPDEISPEACRSALRKLAPAKKELIWKARSGKWITAPRGWHVDDLAKMGYVMKLDNRWRLSSSGLALARYIDEDGEGVADWTRSMIKAARKK